MCNSLYTMYLCCMYINAIETLDIWYTIKKKERYQPITKCNYWPVLGSLKNCNIILLSQKSTPYDAFEEIHEVVLDGISDNMASLVEYREQVTLTQLKQQQLDFMLSYSNQKHIHYNITQKWMDKIYLLKNQLSKHSVFVICKKSIIGFWINIPNSNLPQCRHAKYFIPDLM